MSLVGSLPQSRVLPFASNHYELYIYFISLFFLASHSRRTSCRDILCAGLSDYPNAWDWTASEIRFRNKNVFRVRWLCWSWPHLLSEAPILIFASHSHLSHCIFTYCAAPPPSSGRKNLTCQFRQDGTGVWGRHSQ